MKKILICILSFVFLICGSGVMASSFLSDAAVSKTTKSISNADEFVKTMSDPTVFNDAGVELVLEADIDFEGATIVSPETTKKFMGIFNGNGYTLSNFVLSSTNQYFGLLPQASGATIENLRIAGNIGYEIDPANIRDLYMGVLVGYGENVTFSNCEFDNTIINRAGELVDNNIKFSVYSNVYFGTLAGRIRNDRTSKTENYIRNCINYYGTDIDMAKDTNVFIGGLVGYVQHAYIFGSLSYGNINMTNSIAGLSTSKRALNNIYVGGVLGSANGSMTNVRNSIYGGEMQLPSSSTGLNISKGAIVGTVSSQVKRENINFVYYSSKLLKPSGDDYITQSAMVSQKDNINRDFLTTASNFDPANEAWDFELVWTLINSRFHLQNFQDFTFGFNNILDSTRILERATFKVAGGEENTTLTAKYNDDIVITIYLKEEFQGFYLLNDVLLRGASISGKYTKQEVLNDENEISGYQIFLKANSTTEGTAYSFNIIQREYKCVITVSDEAQSTQHGGVLIDNGTSPSFTDVNITFYGNSRERKIVAEGQDIFIFDHWEMYYRDENGNFTVKSDFESGDSDLSIAFGNKPFDREFKLVAFFTDKDAIKVDFGTYRQNIIKSIVFGGKVFEGQPLSVSPNNSQTLEVVIAKGYEIDIDAFTRDIKNLYGDNPTTTLVTSEPKVDETTGDKTYRFNINMRYITEFEDNSLKLSFLTKEEGADSKNSLLWLYITLPIAAVVVAAVVLIIILRRRRRGGGDDNFGGSGKVKEKKVSYKDYY